MTDTIAEKPITRRFFMRSAGAAGLATIAAAIPAEASSQSEAVSIPQTPEGILEEQGFKDYIGLYQSFSTTDEMFGNTPYQNEYIYRDMESIIIGNPDIPRFKEVYIDGWGELEDQALDTARVKARSLPILREQEGPGKKMTDEPPENSRRVLVALAEVMPPMIIACPDDGVVFLEGGGATNGNHIEITASKEINSAPVTAIHEGGHLLDMAMERYKQYVRLPNFLEYVTKRNDSIREVLEVACTSRPEDIHKMNDGKCLLSHYFPHEDYGDEEVSEEVQIQREEENLRLRNERKAQVDEWERQFVPADDNSIPESADEDQLYWHKYNRVAYYFGKERIRIYHKTQRNESITDDENTFLEQTKDHPLMREILGEIGHYFVGPVQKIDGGLPLSTDARPEGLLNSLNASLQQIRFKCFSPLGVSARYSEIKETFDRIIQGPPIAQEGGEIVETEDTTNDLLVKHGAEIVGHFENPEQPGKKATLLKLKPYEFSTSNYYYLNTSQFRTSDTDASGAIIYTKDGSELDSRFTAGIADGELTCIAGTTNGRALTFSIKLPSNIKLNFKPLDELDAVVFDASLVTEEPKQHNLSEYRFGAFLNVPIIFAGDLAGSSPYKDIPLEKRSGNSLYLNAGPGAVFYSGDITSDTALMPTSAVSIRTFNTQTKREQRLALVSNDDKTITRTLVEGTIDGQVHPEPGTHALPVKIGENEYEVSFYNPIDNSTSKIIATVEPENDLKIASFLSDSSQVQMTRLYPGPIKDGTNQETYYMSLGEWQPNPALIPLTSIRWG